MWQMVFYFHDRNDALTHHRHNHHHLPQKQYTQPTPRGGRFTMRPLAPRCGLARCPLGHNRDDWQATPPTGAGPGPWLPASGRWWPWRILPGTMAVAAALQNPRPRPRPRPRLRCREPPPWRPHRTVGHQLQEGVFSLNSMEWPTRFPYVPPWRIDKLLTRSTWSFWTTTSSNQVGSQE